MTSAQVAAELLRRYGVRAEPAMVDYVLQRMSAGEGAFPILAADARTGVPVTPLVTPGDLVAVATVTEGAP